MAAASTEIRAIISDLGGVLMNVEKRKTCSSFAKYSSLSAAEIGNRLSGLVVHSQGAERDFSKGLITPLQFSAAMSKQLKLRCLGYHEFERIYSDRFTPKKDALSIIRKAGKKYAVAMLSNTNVMHYKYWKKALGGDMNIFKELVLSFKVHSAKPEPAIYLTAAKRLGFKPEQCVFIDDVKAYVNAAKKAGMLGIRFVSAQQLQRDLGRIGVSV